jgi:hypothetical protein
MKLDRNLNLNGRGKYALIKLREVHHLVESANSHCTPIYELPVHVVDFGNSPGTDFFVIRLKDKYAAKALTAYACAAAEDDPEYAEEILELARRAELHPDKKKPD